MKAVPLPAGVAVIVLDTGTRRSLAHSAYNDRRAECAAAAELLGRASLRDVTEPQLDAAVGGMPPVLARRARHVVTENNRTLAAARAMEEGDPATLGRLMSASHASLRDDYQVSSPALDWMVECAEQQDGCLGARLTGAGFGGCAIALVRAACASGFMAAVLSDYRARAATPPAAYAVRPSAGAWARRWGGGSEDPVI